MQVGDNPDEAGNPAGPSPGDPDVADLVGGVGLADVFDGGDDEYRMVLPIDDEEPDRQVLYHVLAWSGIIL